MSPTLMLLTSARPAVQWTRTRLGSSSVLDRFLSRLDEALGAIASCRVPVPVPIPVPRRPRPNAAYLTVAMLLLGAVPALAQNYGSPGSRSDWNDVADGRLVDVQVLVEGRTTPLYFAPNKFDRHYFQAFKGRNYAIQVRNNTSRRVGVLMAVDGLNVVSGERSSLSRNESMYVLDPFESTVIRGWRTSLSDVRKFVFVDEERSYAERTGQANGDMGWIRVLAFRENAPVTWFPNQVRDRNDPDFGDLNQDEMRQHGATPPAAPEARAQRRGETQETRGYADNGQSNPGTGWGERGYDPVRRTKFVAERRATDHIVLRYEYASGLRALGIRIWNNGRGRTWERERGELGFAQPPRW